MLLYYIRHGDPIYNPDSLTELGHKQAQALVERTSLNGFDEIYCSTSMRAQMTAQPTCERLKKEKILLDWTNEAYVYEEFGLKDENGVHNWAFFQPKYLEKFTSEEVLTSGKKWYEHPDFKTLSFRAGVERVDRETDEFLLSLGYKHDREHNRYEIVNGNEKRVALFAHHGFGIAFLSSVLDIPYPLFAAHFDFMLSCVSVIKFEERNGFAYAKVLQLSNDSHLFKAGIPTEYNGVKI